MKVQQLFILNFLAFLILVTMTGVRNADASTKASKIDEIINTEELFSGKSEFISTYARMTIMPDKRIPPQNKEEMINSLSSNILKDLRNNLRSVWDKNFTEAEIDSILQFKKSPAGKKLKSVMGPFMKHSYETMKSIAEPNFEKITHLKFQKKNDSKLRGGAIVK